MRTYNQMHLTSIICFIIGTLIMANFVQADECSNLVQHLASAQSNYLKCITIHAVPVTICLGCKEEFQVMGIKFEDLRNKTNCTNYYFDHDRINLISTTQSLMTDLWNKAYCNDCFVGSIYEDFLNLITKHEDCLNLNAKSDAICKKCFEEYDLVNSFYINLDQKHNGEICFDMQDKMNRTRFHWSKELKCCKRTFNKTLFIVTSSFIATLPVIFYYGIYAFTRYRERNHDVLYEPDTPRRRRIEPVQQTVTTPPIITATNPVQNSSPISKPKLLDIDSDDSDCSSDSKEEISK